MDRLIPTPLQEQDSDAMLEYQHAFLWAKPGTGKTLTSIRAVEKGGYNRVVVVCPPIAVDMWVENLVTQLGYKYIQPLRSGKAPRRGTTRDGRARPPIVKADAIIVTPSLIGKHKDLLAEYARQGESVLIVDEAHYFKSGTAKRTVELHGRSAEGVGGIGRAFDDVWQLTGTPITRHADDLFWQLRTYRYDILKVFNVETYDKFINEFCRVDYRRYGAGPKKRVVVGSKNLDKLEQLIAACKVIRRSLDEAVRDMPPVTYRTVSVGDMKGKVETVKFNPRDLVRLLADKESQLSKVRRALGIAKAKAAVDYLNEYGNKPVLVGYWHTDVMLELKEQLEEKGHVVRVINGGTSKAQNEETIKLFNMGMVDFLVGQVSAMGVAINLQGMCSHIVMVEELPSPSDFEQFIARVHRRGQKYHVQVDLIRSSHSLDGALVELRTGKKSVIDTIF